jgi:NTE family protein
LHGIVLEGGGAKGAYHIGACKALVELGIKIKGVAGTSVGALNGAMIAQKEIDKAYNLWYNISYSKVINISDDEFERIKNLDINKENVLFLVKKIKEILDNRGLDITPLRNLLNEVINEDKLRNSGIDLGIVTVSLTDMRPIELFIENIPKGKVIDYLIASAYFPAFKLEKMDGKLYLDGGFYDNLPINLLYEKGYRNIIAIRTNGIGRIRKFDKDDAEVKYIVPRESLGRTLDFDTENVRKNLKLGYFDTYKAIKGLRGERYYIKPLDDEKYFINILLNIGEERIKKICKILGYKDLHYTRTLFEIIIPKITDYLNIEKDRGYEDIIIAIFEKLAELYNVNKYKIYSFNEFVIELHKKHREIGRDEVKNIPQIIRQSDLFTKVAKDEIIKEIAVEFLESISKNFK